jgi:3-oxoacyl-[acyl-carrier-protein] synthase II
LTSSYDALSQLVFAGFDSLQALSPTQCRPFDSHRDGLVLGEGAVLTLETLDALAAANNSRKIIGCGAATDLRHLTQPHARRRHLRFIIAACVREAFPDRIPYVNAHGTGTPLNDSAEAAAINR